MKFYLELRCACSACPRSYFPSGKFSDLRIGRSTLEREALDDGWKKIPAKTYIDDAGDLRRTQVQLLCPYCSKRT